MAVSKHPNRIDPTTLTDLQKARLPVICETCQGCGKVCDKEGKPWSRFQKQRNPEVQAGLIAPVLCPTCKGQGVTTAEETEAAEATEEPPASPAVRSILPKQAKK